MAVRLGDLLDPLFTFLGRHGWTSVFVLAILYYAYGIFLQFYQRTMHSRAIKAARDPARVTSLREEEQKIREHQQIALADALEKQRQDEERRRMELAESEAAEDSSFGGMALGDYGSGSGSSIRYRPASGASCRT